MTNQKENTIDILGKKISSAQHTKLIISYAIFILFIWPWIAGSYAFISGIICFIPVAISNSIYDFLKSIKLYRKVVFILIIILTFIYSLFLSSSSLINILHYLVNLFFGYILTRTIFFKDNY